MDGLLTLLMLASLISILLAVVVRGTYRILGLSLLLLGTMLIVLQVSGTMIHEVTVTQQYLHSIGLYNGPFDGNLQTDTIAAIRKYQESKGLPVTGTLDKAAQEVMRKDTSMKLEPGIIPGTGRYPMIDLQGGNDTLEMCE